MRRARHIPMNERQFRSEKRREWRAVMATLGQLRIGSAFLPPLAYEKFGSAAELLEEARKETLAQWSHSKND